MSLQCKDLDMITSNRIYLSKQSNQLMTKIYPNLLNLCPRHILIIENLQKSRNYSRPQILSRWLNKYNPNDTQLMKCFKYLQVQNGKKFIPILCGNRMHRNLIFLILILMEKKTKKKTSILLSVRLRTTTTKHINHMNINLHMFY